jgi:exodeoxyribonuclease V alpha subunit
VAAVDTLRCVVERITYQNEDNGYTVLKVRAKGFRDLVAVVGNMASVAVGSVLTVRGEWRSDPKRGRQLAAAAYEETLPATALGIEKYLGSGLIKGVGPVYAKKIVAQFGERTLEVIETEPACLIEVPGIGKKRVGMIKRAWQDQKEIKNVMLFLQSHGVSTAHAAKIFKTYGDQSVATVTENPYKLADDIWGIGFRTADAIAAKLGLDAESYTRCRAGVLYALNELSNDGHCFAAAEQLTAAAAKLLNIDEQKITMTISHMQQERQLITEPPDMLYLPPLFFSETGAARLIRLIRDTPRSKQVKVHPIRGDIPYDEVQLAAIEYAMAVKFMVLTGGPGTGKTTTLKGILQSFRSGGYDILLAAPTGRAAKRMTEATGLEAKTIHRLLEYKPPQGYQRNGDNPLAGDVLIVDEASMVDIVLFYNLLKAVPASMTVILVGDTDQLPSVGPGNVLRDIIDSAAVPVIRLERIFRQAQGSAIIRNAHRINKGQSPELFNGKLSDFFFIPEDDATLIPQLIVDLCAKRLPAHYGADPVRDIQVLCPMQRGDTGARNMNEVLQAALNPSAQSIRRGGTEYRVGDKVMQMRNNYDLDV